MVKTCVCASSIVIREGEVLLLWHEKLGIWLYPGGHMDENEIPYQTALRETKEETGMKITIINTDAGELMKSDEASELQRPFKILLEDVPYKAEHHTHFDMVYLAKPASVAEEKNVGKGEAKKLEWFAEPEIDDLNTFNNVKWVIHKAFAAAQKQNQ